MSLRTTETLTSLHLAVKITKMQHLLRDDIDAGIPGHTLVRPITKNTTLMPKLAVKIQTTASLIRHLLIVPMKQRHMDTITMTMTIKAMIASSAIQIRKTAVDLTDVILLEEGTVLTSHHISLTQSVSKISSSDTLIAKRRTNLTIGMLNLTSMRCSPTIFRIHMILQSTRRLPPSITQSTTAQSISHAALDMEEREPQDTDPLDMSAHTVTFHLIDVPIADTQGTQKTACQANHQKMRSIMPTNALSSSKRLIQDARSHSRCGEAMDRRRDAVTVNSARKTGIHSALPASLSLTATFARLFAPMEPSITRANALTKATTLSKSATLMRNSSMANATESVQDQHLNFRFFASASAQPIWSSAATLFASDQTNSAPPT